MTKLSKTAIDGFLVEPDVFGRCFTTITPPSGATVEIGQDKVCLEAHLETGLFDDELIMQTLLKLLILHSSQGFRRLFLLR